MNDEFCCPEVSLSEECDDFFIPDDCCPRNETVQLTSPTSCLPKEAFKQLKKEIEEANQLLLDLDPDEEDATERPPDRMDRIFHRLQDQFVHLTIERLYRVVKRRRREDMQLRRRSQVSGIVTIVGGDFVLLENKKSKVIVPYDRIIHIGLPEKMHGEIHHSIDLNPKLRRALTFHFGEVVSESPALLFHFFTVDLRFFLTHFDTKKVKIISGQEIADGEITDVNDRFLEWTGKRRKTKSIPLSNIDLLYLDV